MTLKLLQLRKDMWQNIYKYIYIYIYITPNILMKKKKTKTKKTKTKNKKQNKKTGICGNQSSETPFPKSEYIVGNWFC